MQILIKVHQFIHKILNGNEILTTNKDHNQVTNLRKLTCNNPKVDQLKVNAYEQFGLIPSIRSKEFSGDEILTIIKGLNYVANLRKLTRNNPKLDLVMVNAYAKCVQIPSIRS